MTLEADRNFLRVFNDFTPLDLNFLSFFISLLSWPPLGRPLGAPWLPLGALWLPLGALCLPLAAPWLFVVAPSGVFWRPIGCFLVPFAAPWLPRVRVPPGRPLAALGRIWPVRPWPLLADSGRPWSRLAVLGRLWAPLAAPGHPWSPLAALGRS